MNISENPNSLIAVEPMFGQGNDYFSNPRGPADFGSGNAIEEQPSENQDGQEGGFVAGDFRVKTTTSS